MYVPSLNSCAGFRRGRVGNRTKGRWRGRQRPCAETEQQYLPRSRMCWWPPPESRSRFALPMAMMKENYWAFFLAPRECYQSATR
eukprot:1128649-Pleurochrysis_carterae.AAC.1